MEEIFRALEQGRHLSVSELHAALPYECTYGALRVSLRFLKEHGHLEPEKTGGRTYYKPTLKAYNWFRAGG